MKLWSISERLKDFRERDAANVISVFLFIFTFIMLKPNYFGQLLARLGLLVFWLAVFFSILELPKKKTVFEKLLTGVLNSLLVVALILGALATLNYVFW